MKIKSKRTNSGARRMSKCGICDKELDVKGDALSKDCGGDCLECMAVEVGDTDCLTEVCHEYAKLLKQKPNYKYDSFDEFYNSEPYYCGGKAAFEAARELTKEREG